MKIIETQVNFLTKHPVVDVEIANDIKKFNWDFEKGEISIAGFFIDKKITQMILLNKSNLKKFRKEVKDFLSTIKNKKLYSLNTRMETGCFKKLLDSSPRFHEIRPFLGSGATKENLIGYLIEKNLVIPNSTGFKDPLKGESELCLKYWPERSQDVMLHNMCCLIKEAKILKHRDFLKKEFFNIVKEDGWLKNGHSIPKTKFYDV